MSAPRYPLLYQINVRVRLTELSQARGERATLDDIPDAELDRLAEMGFDWVWLLSVWQTGPAPQAISRANRQWRREFAETLPDLKNEDIAGSGFAIQDYAVHRGDGHARAVREHFHAALDYQDKLARFLENHDEPPAASTFATGTHQAAAIITYLSPGLRFFHQGQLEGRRKRISPHLVRAPGEPVDAALQEFYKSLTAVLRQPIFRGGAWNLLECLPAWDGNLTWDCFIAWCWQRNGERRIVAVNYAGNQSQCYVRMPFADLAGRMVRMLHGSTHH